MELVEREELLAQLSDYLDEARDGSGRLVLVGGEAGVGKTSLLRAFVEDIPSGERVLWGSCDPLSTPRPLAPFRDMESVGGLLEQDLGRHQLLTAVLAELGPATVMVVEDAHWADEATLDALRFVGRRVDGTRGLVLVTYRDDEVGTAHPLRAVLGDLATAPGCRRLSVVPLTPAGVAILASGHAVEPVQLHRITAGNAFYVTEVLAAPGWTVPATVADAVLARVARLSPQAQDLLDLVSTAPRGLEPEIAETLLLAAARALDECTDRGVLVLADGLATFRHELARLAVEGSVPAGTRRELHRRLLEALVRLPGADPARLAHHAEAAGDDGQVLRHAPQAALQAAARGAHSQAAAQYARALRFADSRTSAERAELLEALSLEQQITGRITEAIGSRQSALGLRRELEDPLREGENLFRLSQLFVTAGRTAEAEASSRDAIALLEAAPESVELGGAYRVQAYLRMIERDCEDAVDWGRRAIAVGERWRDLETLAFAHNAIGASYLVSDHVERGVEHMLESLRLAREAGRDNLVAGALVVLGSGAGEVYQTKLAERYLTETIAYNAERDIDDAYAYSWLALIRLFQGRWSDAEQAATIVLEREHANAISRIMAFLALGRLRTRRGDPNAGSALDQALSIAAEGSSLQRLAPLHAARAEQAWLAGDVVRTAEEALAVYERAMEKRHAWFVGELAYWQWKVGRLDDVPTSAALPFRLQMEGDWSRAAADWKERSCPYEQARALAEGDERAMRKALEIYTRLGAEPAADRLREHMRRAGITRVPAKPRAATRASPGQLTRRQLEVLRLLEDGLSNSDIANRLFITEKTAAHHVSAILRKLGVRSRGEAAATARKMGIPPAET